MKKLKGYKTVSVYHKYDVYYYDSDRYAGQSIAVSPEKAINNVRWKYCKCYVHNDDLYAVEID